MKKISGILISNLILEELKEEILTFKDKPKLVVIQIGNNKSSNSYILQKEKKAKEIGIDFKHIKFNENIEESKVIKTIKKLNKDSKVNGIIVQLPISKHLDKDNIINTINYKKDVDGLTIMNQGLLTNNQNGLFPCTALGIIELLKRTNIKIEGKNVLIIGRSTLVGKPLINLFLNENATVTISHSKTKDIKKHTKVADIIVVAVGIKYFLTKEMINQNQVIIDVGINSSANKLYGDVDYNGVYDQVKMITPVPGGVGPMTVAMLIKNTIKSYKLSNKKSKEKEKK